MHTALCIPAYIIPRCFKIILGAAPLQPINPDPNNPADPGLQTSYNHAAIQVAFLAGVMYTGELQYGLHPLVCMCCSEAGSRAHAGHRVLEGAGDRWCSKREEV